MITLQKQIFVPVPLETSNIRVQNKNLSTNPNKNTNAIDKSLLALAILGMATLSSCSYSDIDSMDEVQEKTELVRKYSDTEAKYPVQRCENILRAMGALTEDATLKSIKTISCTDTSDKDIYIKPVNLGVNEIKVIGMNLYPDCSGDGQYKASIRNAENGGLDMKKLYEDGTIEKTNLVLNKDGSVTESLYVLDNYMVEKSIFRKNNSGVVEREFSDGTIEKYSNFSNDYDYPEPITFDASADDWSSISVSGEI